MEFYHNECIREAKFYCRQRKLRKREVLAGQPPGFVPIIFTGDRLSLQGNILLRQPAVIHLSIIFIRRF